MTRLPSMISLPFGVNKSINLSQESRLCTPACLKVRTL